MGKGAYIRIQNKSTYAVNVDLGQSKRVDDIGMNDIQGDIQPGGQLPVNGEHKFGGVYEYIEGDNRFFFQKDGYFEFIVNVADSSPSSLYLKVDHQNWWAEDKSPDKESLVKVVADADEEEEEQFKIEVRIYNNYNPSTWMADMAQHISETPLCRVGLPGTHDSGTYKFDKNMGASPDSDLTSTIEDKLDKGRLLGAVTDMILNIFKRLCQCQEKSFREQLEAGIRYLDLRVAYHEESGKYFTCHGVYCVDMQDAIQEINEFLTANPKEIVILDVNHLYEMEEHHAGLVNDMLATLGDKVADSRHVKPYSTVGEYWDQNYQAVILYCGKSCLGDYPGVLWSQGYIRSPWPNVGEPQELHEKLQQNVENHDTNKFFVVQGLLTPDVELIKNEILSTGGISLKSIATRCSPKVVDWVAEEWKEQPLNIVIVDFFENCSLVPAVINYNQK